MSRSRLITSVVFVTLVALGVGLRVLLRDIPNFAPVAALALFAGYWFSHRAIAMAVPLSVMILSDAVIGTYQWQIMLLVYAMLILPAVWGAPLRRFVESRFGGEKWRPAALVLGCSLGASLSFFLVTNLGVWMWFNHYPHTLEGLLQCYTAALPFFRFTVAGDLFFATTLFGSLALARVAQPAPQLAAPAA